MTSFEVPSVGLRAIFIEHTLRVSVSYGHHLRNAAAIAGCSGGGPRRAGPLSKYQVPGPWVGRGSEPGPVDRQHGRVVKALDSKSNGHCPRRFESGCCRTVYFFLKFFILVFFFFCSRGVDQTSLFFEGGYRGRPVNFRP